jgi:hypothetical protein
MEAALYCVHADAAYAQQQKNGCIRSDLAPSEILDDPQVSHDTVSANMVFMPFEDAIELSCNCEITLAMNPERKTIYMTTPELLAIRCTRIS